MTLRAARVLAAACLVWLSGCETTTKLGDLLRTNSVETAPEQDSAAASAAASTEPDVTGATLAARREPAPVKTDTPVVADLPGDDANDDLALGKRHFRAANYGLAERHFRRAVEAHPRNAEAWLGLAASYDRLSRFDLADRAYTQAIAIAGPTAPILNNQGFSYLLRGDLQRAREKLTAARAKDRNNSQVKANLDLLAEASRRR